MSHKEEGKDDPAGYLAEGSPPEILAEGNAGQPQAEVHLGKQGEDQPQVEGSLKPSETKFVVIIR